MFTFWLNKITPMENAAVCFKMVLVNKSQ